MLKYFEIYREKDEHKNEFLVKLHATAVKFYASGDFIMLTSFFIAIKIC